MRELIEITHQPGAGVLATLRALAIPPYEYLSDARQVAEAQARLLRDLLVTPSTWLPTTITELIPSITIELIDSIPIAGTAFWAEGRWNIHLRASDDAETRHHTLLHEIKHIIDHPLRVRPNGLAPGDWEALADHFADVVLTRRLSPEEPTTADVAAA
jgi:hypothetical protein